MNDLTAPSNIAHELEKLDELRKKGLVTDGEFNARKQMMFAAPSKAGKPKFRGFFLVAIVLLGSLGASAAYDNNPAIIFVAMFVLFIYLLPSFIAYQRWHQNRLAIFIVNFLFGLSVIGWVGSLIWSCTAVRQSSVNSS